jgi:hypothetical protein
MLSSPEPKRPHRQSRHCLGGQLLFELEPVTGRPLDAL